MIAHTDMAIATAPRGAHSLTRLVHRWKRNGTARAIRRDRRYFQPLGYGRTNRLQWQICLILEAPNNSHATKVT
jgi:hypothetical protein